MEKRLLIEQMRLEQKIIPFFDSKKREIGNQKCQCDYMN